ncbi:hypothetical protein [Hamadaea tsunoensis]|uniref:hypothetical protein n=1 Tax=Hamadaea tsunoensis TaxID=53368 RepID=UPI0003F93AA0|nr:hypothetical protein [Hamadaea tsunoensis]
METVHTVLVALAERYAFADLAALVGDGAGGTGLSVHDVARIQQLCAFGQRLLDLDAEDFGVADAAAGANVEHRIADSVSGDRVPEELRQRALECRMPQSAREQDRGALASLVPAYSLLLEVIQVRWLRRETSALVAAVHIISEYAPLLVWERVLGHAGDPLRLPEQVNGEHSLWGDFEGRECPHTKAEKSAAQRVLRVAHEPPSGWRAYLDRQHSNTSHALGVCAGACPRPCSVLTRWTADDRELLGVGSRLAATLNDSSLVKLRHAAPVGHGFGVPSRSEIIQAWERGRASLARHAPAVAEEDGFPLPGFAALVSAFAGRPVKPATLLADTAEAITRELLK